jgi:hypothetical protein
MTGVDSGEITSFLSKTQLCSGNVDELILLYQTETQRLMDQLPLLRVTSRKEFIKTRVNNVDKASAEYKQLSAELELLNNQLATDIPQYERKYNTKFTYKQKN